MSVWKEAKNPALKKEEAAMLPAMARPMAGEAALKAVMNGTEKMTGKRLSNRKSAWNEEKQNAPAGKKNVSRPVGGRAALRQVWNRP